MYMFVDAEWMEQQFRMKLKPRSCWQTMQEPVAVAAGVSPLPTCILYQELTGTFLPPVV